MNKSIRRLSFGLAVLICIHGFGVSVAEEPAPQEPQPTVKQEQTSSAPVSAPEPEKPAADPAPQPTAKEEKPTAETQPNTQTPTEKPTAAPTAEPTAAPTAQPTAAPTAAPTVEITQSPTVEATQAPAATATVEATAQPSIAPTADVSIAPSLTPSVEPTIEATLEPTLEPTPSASLPTEDTVAPVLHRFVCAPNTQVSIGTGLSFTAEFSDNVSLRKVQIFVDDVLAKERGYASAPAEHVAFTYETASLSVGEHWLYVVGTDAAGNATSGNRMKVTITEGASDTPNPTLPSDAICGVPAHAHGADCFDAAGALICKLSEHVHTDTCFPEATPAPDGEEDQAAEDVPTDDEIVVAPRVDTALWNGVRPSDERGMAIPMLFQGDYPQTACTIRGVRRSVATSGCGATSLSMVIAYLTGNTEQNPYTLFCDSVDEGRYHGAGWSHETLSHYAAAYGLHSKWVSNQADTILEALRAGKPVIAHMGPGIFTIQGHYLVLRGVTEDGLILMNDPNSRANCERAFPIESLLKQAKTSAAFMVCWTDASAENAENAAEEGETEALWGDLNGSGALDVNDVQLLYEMLNRADAEAQCDLNGDGLTDQADLDLLLQAVLNPNVEVENEGGIKA